MISVSIYHTNERTSDFTGTFIEQRQIENVSDAEDSLDTWKEAVTQPPPPMTKLWESTPQEDSSENPATSLWESRESLRIAELEFRQSQELDSLRTRRARLERMVETCNSQINQLLNSSTGSRDDYRERGVGDGRKCGGSSGFYTDQESARAPSSQHWAPEAPPMRSERSQE
jgi:hypothetical protein